MTIIVIIIMMMMKILIYKPKPAQEIFVLKH